MKLFSFSQTLQDTNLLGIGGRLTTVKLMLLYSSSIAQNKVVSKTPAKYVQTTISNAVLITLRNSTNYCVKQI